MDGYPADLEILFRLVEAQIIALTHRLQLNQIEVDQWHDEMLRLVARYAMAAVMLGMGLEYIPVDGLPPEAEAAVRDLLETQAPYLTQFAREIELEINREWHEIWDDRAKMYGETIQVPYWKAATRFVTLPAYPGDGSSECLSHDRCQWQIDWLDPSNQDLNAYWITESDAKVCHTCANRGANWNPFRIRGGRHAS